MMPKTGWFVWIFVMAFAVQAAAYEESQSTVEIPSPDQKTDVYRMAWTTGVQKFPEAPLMAGTSRVLKFDRPVVRVAVSDPAVCDVVPVTRDELILNSKKAGKMNLMVWDDSGSVSSYEFECTTDTQKLHDLLRRIDPKAQFMVVPYQDSLAVYGNSETKAKQTRIDAAVKAFDAKALNFVNTANPKQVMLEVRFAEINRRDNKDFKLDADWLSRFVYGRSTTGQTGITGTGGSAITGNYPQGSTALTKSAYAVFDANDATQAIGNLAMTYVSKKAFITSVLHWLETKNVLKIVARPNLMAKDGEKATFLVGGEYAIPVSSDGDISVQYQEYGTRLEFTPEILDDENISLKIKTEQSELDYANTVEISSSTVPSLLKRENETVAQLKDNQTLIIGGMITQRINRINYKLPILGDLPVLKVLFSSESFTRTDVELLVVITPHIVQPFRMPQGNKFFYDPERVAEAVQPMVPPYPDPQGDAIQDLIVQTEDHTYFDAQQAKEDQWYAKFKSSRPKS